MFNLLEHVSDPKALLTETFRLLRPNGVLLARVPNMAFHDLLWKMPGITHVGKQKGLHYLGGLAPPQHLFGFTPRTLSALLESVGYSSPQIRPAVPHNAERKAAQSRDLWNGSSPPADDGEAFAEPNHCGVRTKT